jgi:peptide/nickel transport system substrate-binding protein
MGMVIVTMAAVFLMACGGEKESGEEISRIVIARPKDSDNLDPVTSVGNTNIWIYNLILDSLVKTTDDGSQIIPNLAESWTLSEDNLVYTFTLKPGIKFSDGTDVTGADWVFSFERAMSELASHWEFASDNIAAVAASGDRTLEVTLKAPSPAMLANFSMFSLGVQSKAHYDTVGEEGYVNGIIGTGPFMLKSWNKGEELVLGRNPYYHKPGLPLTEEIVFKVVPDDAARVMQLQAGEADVITFVPYSSLKEIAADRNVTAVAFPATETRFIAMNEENPYLANLKVRQALNLATDNQLIVDMALYGYGSRGRSFLQDTSPYLNQGIPLPRQDLAGARALLAEAGYPEGFTVNMLINAGDAFEEQIATILKEQWGAAGVTVDIMPEEAANYKDKLYGLKFDTVIDYWTDDVPDPIQYLDAVCDFSLYAGFDTNFQNDRVSELNDLQALELDTVKRAQYIHEIQQIIYDNAVFIPLCYVPYGVAMDAGISGFEQTPLGNYRFENLAKVKR